MKGNRKMFYERNPYFENNALLKFLIDTGTSLRVIIVLATVFAFIFTYKTIKKLYKTKKLTHKVDLVMYAISLITSLLFVTAPIYYLYENYVDTPIKPSEYGNYLKITDQKIESKDTNKVMVIRNHNFNYSYDSYNINDYDVTLHYDINRQSGYLNIIEKNKKTNDKIKNESEIYLNDRIYDEINKLNKYLAVSKQKNTQLKFDKEDVLSVSGEFGIINQIQFQGRSFAGASVEMYSIVDTGNIVYTKSPLKANPYGIIKTNYGIPGIVSTLYAVYLPNENVFPGFVERYFENDLRLNSYLKPLVNKGAKNDMKVSDENALLGAVIFPQLEEQVAISDYFTNLDKFIQSHKDKITQLETLKKKLLQNMFI